MKIFVNLVNDVHVFNLAGRFDAQSVPEVQSQLQTTLSQEGNRLIFNMADVEFVDSTALSTLVKARRSAVEKHGDLYLCALSQTARMLFEMTRLDSVFAIFPDESTALMAFSVGESL